MTYDPARALSLLKTGTKLPGAQFRTGQEDAVRSVVAGNGRLLVVQRTGWGKSFVYFIATKLLREQGSGPALLISPLLALMRNQLDAAKRMGVRAETINSDNRERWQQVEDRIRADRVDILLISPERLANERFRHDVLSEIAARISLLVIDEAHCISDWGHDFRPHYRLIERIIHDLPPNLRLLATTATANNRVMQDLSEILGPDLGISRGDLARPSLSLQSIRLPSQAERMAWLAEQLPDLPGSGIVYTLTVRDANRLAAWLKHRGIEVEAYTGSSGDHRPAMERALQENRVKALVATTALGMGFDKPDLGFVVHFQTPGSVVAYYQQVGRAGRSLDAARGVLLSGTEDTEITDYFIQSAFPTREEAEQVLSVLEAESEGLSVREIESRVNVSHGRIEKTVQLLSLESPAPIAKLESKWQLTAAELSDAFWERADRLTRLRQAEQSQMQEYVQLTSGHMEYLIEALDGEHHDRTGPSLPDLPQTPDPTIVMEATQFLRRSSLSIKPRTRWPPGKPIDAEHRAKTGRALCVWGDAGWGQLVQTGKYSDNRFSSELIEACAGLVREWCPNPFPEWVTAIPSRRRPLLVPNFALHLAESLGLPFSAVFEKKADRPEQKTRANSDKQARNVLGSLKVDRQAILRRPVLLVDDMVDSRWTFTIAAWELRRRGSGEVWPLALADSSGTRT